MREDWVTIGCQIALQLVAKKVLDVNAILVPKINIDSEEIAVVFKNQDIIVPNQGSLNFLDRF